MSPDTRDARPGGLAAQGRGAPTEELRRRLASAPPVYLEGAIDNPALTPTEVGLLLRNRLASPAVLSRVGGNRGWLRHYEIKRGLVHHANTPCPISLRLVSQLYWRDVAETVHDPRLHPALRRQALKLLRQRLPELTRGEKVSLARRASGELIGELIGGGDRRVLAALLGNPRLRHDDAVGIAAGQASPGEVLEQLSRHPEWGRQRGVRYALLRNARTPVATALRLVAAADAEELDRLATDRDVRRIVRVGARRRLDGDDGDEGDDARGSRS